MKVFIWGRIEYATDSYHRGGGVVVIADNEERARELANTIGGCTLQPHESPDNVRDVNEGPEVCVVFPDAGCC